jgi:tight adherence protein C
MAAGEIAGMAAFVLVFLATFLVVLWIVHRLYPEERRALARLRDLSHAEEPQPEEARERPARSALPRLGLLFMPREKDAAGLKSRFARAGIYRARAAGLFYGSKLLLLVLLPLAAAWLPYSLGFMTLHVALMTAAFAAAFGMFCPDFWLKHLTNRRQRELRRALPDTLDMLVLCLEGGESLMAAVQRVTRELQVVYPLLGAEMHILLREIQLGLTPGQALRKFGERCGLDEVRDLASVLLQSERHGASIARALRIHADAWRIQRQQQAEEHAQKAAVKVLFPTLLCIFPAIFVVLLGPAAFQLARLFSR